MTDTDDFPAARARRSPAGYLWWLVTSQGRRSAAGAVLGSVWMVGLTLPPYVLSRAVDGGLHPGAHAALIGWSAVLLGVGAFNAYISIIRHRVMTRVRMHGAFSTVRALVAQIMRLGATLPRKVSAGEVVTAGMGDVSRITDTLTVVGPGAGAVLGYGAVAALLLSISTMLAVVVLVGVPLLAVLMTPLLRRLQDAETAYRGSQSRLAARFEDLAVGLRVLNGFGGKDAFAARYRTDSLRLQTEGYRVAASSSWIQALAVGVPTLFLAIVTWLAARMAVAGTITIGDVVAVYGYTAVLAVPVSFIIRGVQELSHAFVAARRVIDFLNLEPDIGPWHGGAEPPDGPAVLHDPTSGVEIRPGELTALACARPADGVAVADRLGRFVRSSATWGDVPLDAIPRERLRERILVADNEADLFAGTVRDVLRGRGDHDDIAVTRSVHTAMAEDVVRGLPAGLDSTVEARGTNLSGGQRQRIRLARALLAGAEILIAVEPTSAVDAHTEAGLARRLRGARTGATLVTSTSPLVLGQVDTVQYMVDGSVVARGSHEHLLAECADYRALVSRSADHADRAPVGRPGSPIGDVTVP